MVSAVSSNDVDELVVDLLVNRHVFSEERIRWMYIREEEFLVCFSFVPTLGQRRSSKRRKRRETVRSRSKVGMRGKKERGGDY